MKIIDVKVSEMREINFKPRCPHCNMELDEVYKLGDDKGLLEAHLGYCFVCPHCRKVLGFSSLR